MISWLIRMDQFPAKWLFDPTLANAARLKPKAIGETARSVLPEADGRIQVTRKKSSVWNNWCENKR